MADKSERALTEEKILEFWKENEIFEKSLEKESPKGDFVFYEGPPTANGRPAIHHLEARAFKDILPRYKTMRGYHVRRKAGWDTHGLPVELEVEKELGLKSKKEIEEYGIAKFNQKCKESVWKYLADWQKFTERIGYWVDQKNPYITYAPEYMESLWWTVGQVEEKGLLYKDYKVLPWCPRCGTALSSHELAQGYKDVKDLSVYVKFKVTADQLFSRSSAGGQPDTRKSLMGSYILAWTTTPWTLPGNVALAVGEDIDYVKVKTGGKRSDLKDVPRSDLEEPEYLILAKERLSVLTGEYEIIEELKGKDLVGLEYEPLYTFLKDNISGVEKEKLINAYKVYPADFVTTTDGTGVVHTAVMYGADDFALGNKIGLPKYHLVGDNGIFKEETGFLSGRFVKDEETAVEIIKDLAHRGLLYKKEKYEHSYPHCWRCKTPLIYFARDSWYIKMSTLKDELVSENRKINWQPEHIKEGRFGEWLREIKDWAISRERYWGTPLPIWVDDKGDRIVVDSVETLKKHTQKSGNEYFVMRHGEAGNNVLDILSSKLDNPHDLTEKGQEQVKEAISELKNIGIELIIASPVLRTKHTAEIVAEILKIPKEKLLFDERLKEINVGNYDGKTVNEYRNFFGSFEEKFEKSPEGGENYNDIRKRLGEFLYEIENKYQNQKILIVTHDVPTWLLSAIAEGLSQAKAIVMRGTGINFFENAQVGTLYFTPIPHNENFELDLHRPYVDSVILHKDNNEYRRVKEVMDVWFDSGAMPVAQDHYPFGDGKKSDLKEPLLYPADFISEAIDQTRGWFYTLLAVGVLLGKGTPYKNVICLGHLLDKDGKKMSKSIGNVVNPWDMMDKFGVDALRFWMYSVNQPGESKNFDEKTVSEYERQVFGLLYNVLAFYELYRDKEIEVGLYDKNPKHILDKWVLARLDQLINLATEKLDAFEVLEPARAIRDFIGDLSTWYLRRSRERIKDGDIEAKRTLYFVLKTLAKVMAPFTPFSAEDIWLKLKVGQNKESIHLTNWPEATTLDETLIKNMQNVRDICTVGNSERKKLNIPVRQPLQKLFTKTLVSPEYQDILKDELNIKEVVLDETMENSVALDITITPELKTEGNYRELVRVVQDMRKKAGLMPEDQVDISIETNETGKELVNKFVDDFKKTTGLINIDFTQNEGEEIKIDQIVFKIKIVK